MTKGEGRFVTDIVTGDAVRSLQCLKGATLRGPPSVAMMVSRFHAPHCGNLSEVQHITVVDRHATDRMDRRAGYLCDAVIASHRR